MVKKGHQEGVRDEGTWCVRCLGTGSVEVGMEVGVAHETEFSKGGR